MQVPEGVPNRRVQGQLLEIAQEHCLAQVVNIHTREDKTLDLLLTNSPSPVNRVKGMLVEPLSIVSKTARTDSFHILHTLVCCCFHLGILALGLVRSTVELLTCGRGITPVRGFHQLTCPLLYRLALMSVFGLCVWKWTSPVTTLDPN